MLRPFVPLALGLSSLLAACATAPAEHYYSLLPAAALQAGREPGGTDAAPAETGRIGTGRAQPASIGGHYVISVGPVTVPEQVDRPQIVLVDPASTQVTPLSGYLWAAALNEEIRAALADDLSRRLGVLDVSSAQAPADVGVWTVGLRVQRFTSVYGQQAAIQAGWRLTPNRIPGRKPVYCEGMAVAPAGASVSDLVAGHRAALSLLGELIATQIAQGVTASPRQVGGASGAQALLKGCTAAG